MDPMFTKLNNDLENVYGLYNTKRNSKKHEKQNLSYRKTSISPRMPKLSLEKNK